MATTTRAQTLASTASGSAPARRGRREITLLGGSLVAAAIAHGASMLAPAATSAAADPALARLLFGMVLVKLALVAAMAGLAAWRFRHPLADRAALGYQVCVWAALAATVLI